MNLIHNITFIFKPGDHIMTLQSCSTPEQERRDWTQDAIEARRWGVTGIILRIHNWHGLCYRVQHDSPDLPNIGYYAPKELMKFWNIEVDP